MTRDEIKATLEGRTIVHACLSTYGGRTLVESLELDNGLRIEFSGTVSVEGFRSPRALSRVEAGS